MRHFTFAENLGREEFNSLALNKKSAVKAHFLGSYEWGEVSSRRNRTPLYTGVYEDGRLVATALVLKRSLIAGFTYFYIPRGFTMDYSDRELLEFMTGSLKALGRKHKALYFRIDPDIKLHTVDIDGNVIEGESNEDLVAYLEKLGYKRKPLNYGFENEQPRFTFRIPLEGTMDEIEGRYSRTTKTRIRQSHEAGVTVCENRICRCHNAVFYNGISALLKIQIAADMVYHNKILPYAFLKMRDRFMKTHLMKMRFLPVRNKSFYVFQCTGDFRLAMSFQDRHINQKIDIVHNIRNLKLHTGTIHLMVRFRLGVKKRHAIGFTQRPVSAYFICFRCAVAYP
jgi:hypothetical protein